jgi:hypothetical protein
MRGLARFSVLLVVILVVSSVGSAAPTKIEYRLTGGTQNATLGPPFTPNGGPITTGHLTLSLFVDGCATPPQPGSDACVRELYFRTPAAQTYRVQDVSFPDYPLTTLTYAFSSKLSLYAYKYVSPTPAVYWKLYTVRLRTRHHQLRTTDPLWTYGYWAHMYPGKSTMVPNTVRRLYNVQGFEVGAPLPASTNTGRLAIAVLLLATPLVVVHLRHRAARAKRRPS